MSSIWRRKICNQKQCLFLQSISSQMNQRDVQFLTHTFTRYYGRVGTTQIDVKEILRYMDWIDLKETNPFLCYAITEKSDQEKREDVINFPQLINRINNTLLNKADTLGIEKMLHTLDGDKDGYVGPQDVISMNEELGTCQTEQKVCQAFEKLTEDGGKISKGQLSKILF